MDSQTFVDRIGNRHTKNYVDLWHSLVHPVFAHKLAVMGVVRFRLVISFPFRLKPMNCCQPLISGEEKRRMKKIGSQQFRVLVKLVPLHLAMMIFLLVSIQWDWAEKWFDLLE